MFFKICLLCVFSLGSIAMGSGKLQLSANSKTIYDLLEKRNDLRKSLNAFLTANKIVIETVVVKTSSKEQDFLALSKEVQALEEASRSFADLNKKRKALSQERDSLRQSLNDYLKKNKIVIETVYVIKNLPVQDNIANLETEVNELRKVYAKAYGAQQTTPSVSVVQENKNLQTELSTINIQKAEETQRLLEAQKLKAQEEEAKKAAELKAAQEAEQLRKTQEAEQLRLLEEAQKLEAQKKAQEKQTVSVIPQTKGPLDRVQELKRNWNTFTEEQLQTAFSKLTSLELLTLFRSTDLSVIRLNVTQAKCSYLQFNGEDAVTLFLTADPDSLFAQLAKTKRPYFDCIVKSIRMDKTAHSHAKKIIEAFDKDLIPWIPKEGKESYRAIRDGFDDVYYAYLKGVKPEGIKRSIDYPNYCIGHSGTLQCID